MSDRYAVLLRAINLGAKRRVAMPDFKSALHDCGFTDVTTIVQSGNAVLTADGQTALQLEQLLEVELSERLGLSLDLLVRDGDEIKAVVENNPFPQYADQGSKLSVTFLRNPASGSERDAVANLDLSPDEVALVDRELYMWAPDRAGRSRSASFKWDKVIAPSVATNRNWNTVLKINELMVCR